MCIDTGYVILQNDVNREPCRLLQVALLQGVPCAKHLQKVGCYQTSSMAWQCNISARRDPRPYLMVNYASYAVFRAGCEVVIYYKVRKALIWAVHRRAFFLAYATTSPL